MFLLLFQTGQTGQADPSAVPKSGPVPAVLLAAADGTQPQGGILLCVPQGEPLWWDIVMGNGLSPLRGFRGAVRNRKDF